MSKVQFIPICGAPPPYDCDAVQHQFEVDEAAREHLELSHKKLIKENHSILRTEAQRKILIIQAQYHVAVGELLEGRACLTRALNL